MDHFDLKHTRDALWQALHQAARQVPFDQAAFEPSLAQLTDIDRFWTYPGRGVMLQLAHYLAQHQFTLISQLVGNCLHQLHAERYRMQTVRPFQTHLELLDRPIFHDDRQLEAPAASPRKPYFEVLIVHPLAQQYEMLYRQNLATCKSAHDEFCYDIVLVDCAQDALTAVLANSDIQACVYLHHVPAASADSTTLYARHAQHLLANTAPIDPLESVEINLCRTVRCVRPELDHYLITDQATTHLSGHVRNLFDRVLFHVNPFGDLHQALLNGVRQRFATPFFDALQAYSRQPKSVFHALPLSRGASVKDSPWIHDMLDFYGDNLFLAETSSTQGGLDSLLDPTGAILQAHTKAAQTFGADTSYFVTNGTSTSNKIVLQANIAPGDIVLVSTDCHKSIPYAVMLAGAFPIFLETWPLSEHDLYGGIELAQIKAVLLDLKRHGRLDRLKQITLTNSTFDGLIYHCEKFMLEVLAIKPDVIFHWDEAWSAFAHFHPLYLGRTAMSAVHKIRQRLQDPAYQRFHQHWQAEFDANPDEAKWLQPLYPDPQKVQLRVYATQSTHKTLTALRQGSMIHVADAQFDQPRFLEALRTHTSTSPNYQIIASLDVGRRQAALEGFHRVRETLALSLQLRQRIGAAELLRPWFDVLQDEDLIGPELRASRPRTAPEGLGALCARWGDSDFVVDPTRITLGLHRTGMDGGSFRQLLMTRYDIQVNKTSRHTVLLLINIGATQASVDYLMQVLHDMAARFHHEQRGQDVADAPPGLALPSQRHYHPLFRPFADGRYQACDVRAAYFAGTNPADTDYAALSTQTLQDVRDGRVLVSAGFVTPYPPGYPVLVPGQIITAEILSLFQHFKVKEIHGFCFERGFKVLRQRYLDCPPPLRRTP